MKILKIVELENNVQCLLRRGMSEDEEDVPVIEVAFYIDEDGVFLKISIEVTFKTGEERDQEFMERKTLTPKKLQNTYNGVKKKYWDCEI